MIKATTKVVKSVNFFKAIKFVVIYLVHSSNKNRKKQGSKNFSFQHFVQVTQVFEKKTYLNGKSPVLIKKQGSLFYSFMPNVV